MCLQHLDWEGEVGPVLDGGGSLCPGPCPRVVPGRMLAFGAYLLICSTRFVEHSISLWTSVVKRKEAVNLCKL